MTETLKNTQNETFKELENLPDFDERTAENEEQIKTPEWKAYVDTLSDDDIRNDNFDPDKLTRTADDFHLSYDDYPILRQQAIDKKQINIQESASMHATATQELIGKIDGSDPEIPQPGHVIYLDKSGHPLSWSVNVFWDDMAKKDENGAPVPRPPHDFVNIDRISVIQNMLGIPMNGDYGAIGDDRSSNQIWREEKHRLEPKHFAKLRALFLKDGLDPEENLTPEEILTRPSTLDNQEVLIVDEVAFKGTTLEAAKDLFEGAFPNAKFTTTTYWPDSADRSTPVWYPTDHSKTTGRGIGDLDPAFYHDQYDQYPNNITYARAYGSNFKSGPLNLDEEPGNESRLLMHDVKQLHEDYLSGNVVINPSVSPYWAQDDRGYIAVVRQGINPRNFGKLKEELFSRPINAE